MPIQRDYPAFTVHRHRLCGAFAAVTAVLVFFLIWNPPISAAGSMRDTAFMDSAFGLRLPSEPVSRRITTRRPLRAGERVDFAVIEGAGCIRRIQCSLSYKIPDINRNVIIRIYFDGEETPYVEAPYGDFFGAMNNRHYYRVNTPFLSIQRWNTYAMFFPMPFANGARIELEANMDTPVYLHVDWHAYPEQEMEATRRFSARWRREMPVQAHGEDYVILDADGPGQLVGYFYAVNLLKTRRVARWSHGGADNIYIDGQGTFPTYLRGIGGEEAFATGWAGGEYPPDSHLFADMPFYVMEEGLPRERPTADEYGHTLPAAFAQRQQMVGYRFFVPDTVQFRESIHLRFGAKDHDISSMVYWYGERPVREFFKMPSWKQMQPGAELPRETYDVSPPKTGSWWLLAPLPFEVLEERLLAQADSDPADAYASLDWLKRDYPAREVVQADDLDETVVWKKREAFHGFVDFNHAFRPPLSNQNTPTFPGVGLARTTIEVPESTTARLRISWVDRMVIEVSGEESIDLGDHRNFDTATVEVPLQAGSNSILLKNSNRGNPFGGTTPRLDHGSNIGGWAFAFMATTPDGRVLQPKTPKDPWK